MRYIRKHIAATLALLLTVALVDGAAAAPITTDSRIKTLVYNANEVYNITTHYGYQSNVELGLKETIETISVGDRVAWQIIPAGRRLFIRAMEENAHTNMTVVTNLRAYQFDLRSSSADAVFGSEELTYVVRFFYPEDAANGAPMPVTYVNDFAPAPPPQVVTAPRQQPPIPTGTIPSPPPAAASPINYRYTYSGPNTIAPLKIYDDGRTTYFKFRGGNLPKVAVITAKGEALDVPVHRTAEGLVAVDLIAPRFSLTQGAQQVVVYNESNGVM